jgi:hypothetical protein
MQNMLLQDVEYKIEETRLGTWRRFAYPTGLYFEEFTSHKQVCGLPLIHFTRGRCPETGRRIIAKGIIAVGRLAVGVLAIGQASVGVLAIGQLAIGLLFGLGQLSTGVIALGQLAIGLAVGIGQIATGYVAIGQFGLGHYVLAQRGLGTNVWDTKGTSEVAREFFTNLAP